MQHIYSTFKSHLHYIYSTFAAHLQHIYSTLQHMYCIVLYMCCYSTCSVMYCKCTIAAHIVFSEHVCNIYAANVRFEVRFGVGIKKKIMFFLCLFIFFLCFLAGMKSKRRCLLDFFQKQKFVFPRVL